MGCQDVHLHLQRTILARGNSGAEEAAQPAVACRVVVVNNVRLKTLTIAQLPAAVKASAAFIFSWMFHISLAC